MIAGFLNLQSFNDGTTKTASVFAQEDANGGTEILQFRILDQFKSVQVRFTPNQGQTVSVAHTASGQGLVTVTAQNSPQSASRILNVDQQPGDGGTGQATTFYRW
jgi:hypothetical protein